MNRKVKGILLTLLLPAGIYALFLALSPQRFGSLSVLRAIFIQSFIPLLCAFGMVFGRSMRMLDLSIGARVIASSMAGGIVAMKYNTGLAGMIIVTIVVSIALGAVCGLVFKYFRIPSIVVSLVIAMIFEVIGAKITNGQGFLKLDKELTILGGMPYNLIVVVIAAVIFYFVYYKTKFCYNVRAISGDELIAKGNGINVGRTKFLAYVIGSFFIGIAAIVQISYASSMSAKLSMESLSMAFKPLMAMIIGVQLQNYVGIPVGIFIGSFMISTLFSGLVALGFPAPAQDIALGLFLVCVISISTNTERLSSFIQRKTGKGRNAAVCQ
ncbi:ABC transporter permease [Murimonas intestini]|uniref:ABC transporter permease n=1 Tax=Murimonas intestini TaxID=1337051 RepID=UPI0011DCE035|nr:hypothetical protein [Murimonas intestini]